MKKQIVKFIVIGVLNTIVYYILYFIFLQLNFDYKISVLFATTLGIIFSFKTLGKYVFNNEDKSLIIRFILSYVFLYGVNLSFIYLFNIFINNYYWSGFFAIFPYSIVSFLINKWVVFTSQGEKCEV